MSQAVAHAPQVNQHVQQHIKNYTSYTDLSSEVVSKASSKQRNGKHILTLLRELSIFLTPNQAHDPSLARCLLTMLNDTSTHDIDRKIIRSTYFLLTEMVLNSPRDSAVDGIALELINRALVEVKNANDSRLCMAWHVVSRIGYAFQQVDLFEESMFTLFKQLRYPEKEKTILFGKKKASQDYENQLHFWTALFSSLRRVRLIPPVNSIPIIFTGCKSSHTQLSRHAFYLLKFAIDKHPAEVCPLFQAALQDSNVLSRASADVHSCIYLMEACKSFIIALEKQQTYTHEPIVDTLNYLFMLLSDTNVKIRMECIRILTDIPPGGMFTKALVSMEMDSPDYVTKMIFSVQPSLEDLFVPLTDELGVAARRESAALLGNKRRVHQPIGFGNVNIGPLCRACIRLGRYVIVHLDALLANTSSVGEESSGAVLLNDVFKPLAKELVRLMKEFRASSVFLSHAYCDTLKALLWLLPPNPSIENRQAMGMYDWFQNQTISALPILQESLTENVMRHIFGRIEEAPANADILLNMALKCAEKAVACFNNTSGQAVGMLIQVWEQFAARKDRTCMEAAFLRSLLSAVDGSLWQCSEEGRNIRSGPEHGLLGLKLFALWALGEYAPIWDKLKTDPGGPPERGAVSSSDVNDLTLRGVMFSFPDERKCIPEQDLVPPLLLVAMTLFQSLHSDEPTLRSVSLESLFKIAMYCPTDSPIRNVIEQELICLIGETFAIPTSLCKGEGESVSIDPRSPPVILESMKLSAIFNGKDTGGSSSLVDCHQGAKLLGVAPNSQSSGMCQDALLYSVALESVKGFSDDSFPKRKLVSDAHISGEDDKISPPVATTDLFGSVDLLGDVFSAPPAPPSSNNFLGCDSHAGSNRMIVQSEGALEDFLVQLNVENFYN